MVKTKQLETAQDPQVDVGAVCRLIIATCTVADEGMIRAALGTASVSSLPAVAKVFGVRETTVRNTWRRDGMPGTAKRGPGQRGQFVLADICTWLLQRGAAAKVGRERAKSNVRDDAIRQELDELALESARLELEMRRAKVARMQGNLIDVELVRSEWNAGMSIFSRLVMGLPRDCVPMVCRRCAPILQGEMDNQLRLSLIQISETRIHGLLENSDVERNDPIE